MPQILFHPESVRNAVHDIQYPLTGSEYSDMLYHFLSKTRTGDINDLQLELSELQRRV